jgi:hypothetical protein
MNRNFEQDYLFGEKQEELIYPILKNYFKDTKLKLTDRYSKFDIISDKINIEIKSRKFTYDKYPSTLIPDNKCIIEEGKRTYIIINFIDSIYYIEYTPEIFKQFNKIKFSRQKDKKFDLDYYFVNITFLTKICDK